MFNRVGILCAGDREFAPFEKRIQNASVTEKAMLRFWKGELEGVPTVCLFSGVCKVNAAIAAQILIDTFHTDCIINAGTAGGMDPSVNMLDTVIATEAVYHDVASHILTEFHPWLATPFLQADPQLIALAREVCTGETVRFGRIATGESFIAEEGRAEILTAFAPLCVDMETAAIAHVCHVNGVPWMAVRSITDDARHSGSGHFEENCAKAAEISAEWTARLVSKIAAFRLSVSPPTSFVSFSVK